MAELFAEIVGGLGLFVVGMWLLTENLKKLASRRLRRIAHRWTASRYTALLWGTLAGGVTQSMTALTFIVVSILRSRLTTPEGAFAMILGGCIGVTGLVMIVTFDIRIVSLYVLGIAGLVAVTERFAAFRPFAASLLGAAMLILGLLIVKEAAEPLSEEPWFRDMVEGTGNSPLLALAVAAFLTFIVQSSSVVAVFGISLASVGMISIDQAIMTMYGSFLGSAAILSVLSAKLIGRSRQAAMYLVFVNLLTCAVVVPLFYCELYLDIPAMRALVLATNLDLDQQLALVYFIISVFPVPIFFAGLGISARVLETIWPTSRIDEMSRMHFIHEHALVDIETSLVLADLEQKRIFGTLPQYFSMVRDGRDVTQLRDATRTVLAEVQEFLKDLQSMHPLQGVEDRNSMLNRQKLLVWLEGALSDTCDALLELADQPTSREFRESICEGVDTVFLALIDAMEADDEASWRLANRLAGDRGELMRGMRVRYLKADPPLGELELINVLLITNAVEEIFFLLSKLEADFSPHSRERVMRLSTS